jgi:hypothetical protein
MRLGLVLVVFRRFFLFRTGRVGHSDLLSGKSWFAEDEDGPVEGFLVSTPSGLVNDAASGVVEVGSDCFSSEFDLWILSRLVGPEVDFANRAEPRVRVRGVELPGFGDVFFL